MDEKLCREIDRRNRDKAVVRRLEIELEQKEAPMRFLGWCGVIIASNKFLRYQRVNK